MNQIILGQLKIINAIPGMQAFNYKDNPDEVETALTEMTISKYTVIFYNPHESNAAAFATLIGRAVRGRIHCQGFDEGGIIVKWGAGDTFRPTLCGAKRFLYPWFNVEQSTRLPIIVFTGAADHQTRQLLDRYVLYHAKPNWDVIVKESPFEGCQLKFIVVKLSTRKNETETVSKLVQDAATKNPPPYKLLVLTKYVKHLNSQWKSLLTQLNPKTDMPAVENVVQVYAHESCVSGEIDLQRFERGQGGNNLNPDGVFDALLNPRIILATLGMLIAGWNCLMICFGILRGQADSTEDQIQAMHRVGRNGEKGTSVQIGKTTAAKELAEQRTEVSPE